MKLEELDHRVSKFEPLSALDGGENGLDIVFRLINEVAALNQSAYLLLEIGMGQQDLVKKHLDLAGFELLRVIRDYQNIPRVVVSKTLQMGRKWH